MDSSSRNDDVYIGVMGITGSGKSSFIARVTGAELEIGHSLQSCTKTIEEFTFERNGRVICLIDTPGFDDTNLSNADNLENLAYYLTKTFKDGKLLDGIIYLHPISSTRMSGSAVKDIRILKKLIGDESFQSVILASTMWSQVQRIDGEKRHKELTETQMFWGEMVSKGAKVFRHDDSRGSALAIVDTIVWKNTKVVLDIQEQIAVQGKSLIETEAGKEVASDFLKEREKLEQRMKENEEVFNMTLKEHDERATQELLQIQDLYRTQREDSMKAMEDMKFKIDRLQQQQTEREALELMSLQRPQTLWTEEDSPLNKHDEQPTYSSYPSRKSQLSISSGKYLEVVTDNTEYTSEDPAFVTKADQQDSGLYTAETIYSPSETSTLPRPQDDAYIDQLATNLFGEVKSCQSCQLDAKSIERISNILPKLLRGFALKVGYKAETQIQRDVSFFVHKYRSHIRKSFERKLSPPGQYQIRRYLEENEQDIPISSYPMEEEFNSNAASLATMLDEDTESSDNDDTAESTSDTSLYFNFIVKTPAYKWLVASLQGEVILTRATPDLMETIRHEILHTLPSFHEVNRKSPSKPYKATFDIAWDPLSFVKQQQYTESPDEALEKAITLTGSVNDAQALTTREYLSQTWPATGKYVMQLVTEAIRNTTYHRAASSLPDGTELSIWINGSKLIVTTIGTGDSLAEVGQQFAWLGAALQLSPFDAGVAICSPSIQTRSRNTITSDQASKLTPLHQIFCTIEFEMNAPHTSGEILSGQCWHNMFRNPVMVNGYPILAKSKRGVGLEMPLNMMAGLVGSERASLFDGKVFIKGFSSMLIAISITRDFLIWHYFYNREGERIAYFQHQLQGVDNVNLPQLSTARHVVGWCKDCEYYAGAVNARYNIKKTHLPRPHAGCVLEKVSISGGIFITGGVTFAIGVKDTPIHLTRNGYIPKLRWIAKKYVVLWDEMDKRGWLINGTSALLHLVRTSLEHYSTDKFSTECLFRPSQMKNTTEYKPDSAIAVLINRENRRLKIYLDKCEDEEETEVADTEVSKSQKEKSHYFLFENLVENHYHMLEQIMDHQTALAGQNGVNLKIRIREHLEGWDFVDLAMDDVRYPFVATLDALGSGWGWVDFVRSIDAITLFCRGFGDIIKPVKFDGMCSKWGNLPTAKNYLAASAFDFRNIIERFGTVSEDLFEPVRGLLLHCLEDPTTPCRHRDHQVKGESRHSDPVLGFYPRRRFSRQRGHAQTSTLLENDTGAFVFGHNYSWGHRRRKKGDELEEVDFVGTRSLASSTTQFTSGSGINPTSNLRTSFPDPRIRPSKLGTHITHSRIQANSCPSSPLIFEPQFRTVSAGIPMDSQSSHSHKSAAAMMTADLLSSDYQPSSTSIESAGSIETSTHMGLEQENNSKSNQQLVSSKNMGGKSLRHERRRVNREEYI